MLSYQHPCVVSIQFSCTRRFIPERKSYSTSLLEKNPSIHSGMKLELELTHTGTGTIAYISSHYRKPGIVGDLYLCATQCRPIADFVFFF